MKNWKGVYIHEPFREKVTFTSNDTVMYHVGNKKLIGHSPYKRFLPRYLLIQDR